MREDTAGDLPRFKSEREIRNKVEAYFKERSGEMLTGEDGAPVLDKQGRPVMLGARPPTVTGLALALGFTHREGLLRYPDGAPFAREVRRARMRAEDHLEGQLMDKDKFQGAKFNLACSFGWPTGERTGESEEGGGGVVLMAPVMPEEEVPEDGPTMAGGASPSPTRKGGQAGDDRGASKE